jgi:SPP1 gp7 family putative phage head morphogenesis protein
MTEPKPRILQVLADQRAALLRRDADTLRRYIDQWQRVEERLQYNAESLALEIADRKARGLPVSRDAIYRLDRFKELLQQTQQTIRGYALDLAPQIEAQQQQMWEAGQVAANEQIAAIKSSFNKLPIDATNTMIGFAADGSPLRDLLQSSWPNAADAMMRALVVNVAMGKNPRVTAREMTKASQASLKRMLTVARTEQLRAYREGSRDIYQRSGVVKRYKRLAAKNARTCLLCLADDGKIYEVSEPMPVHPNCRCTSTPLVDGYTINYGKNGAEWFNSQSASVQREMLGKARYEMYRNGTPLSAFASVHNHPDWGKTLTKLPIDKIGKTSIQSVAPRINHGALAREKLLNIVDIVHDKAAPIREQITKTNEEADRAFAAKDYTRAEKLQKKVDGLWKKLKKETNETAYKRETETIVYQQGRSGFGQLSVTNGRDATQKDKAEWSNGIDAFRSLIGDKLMNRLTVITRQSGDTGRAYAMPGNIFMFKGDPSRTVVHELGHVLEFSNPKIHQAAVDFLNRRTEGETPVPLKQWSEFYGDDEITTPDKFIHPYMGKRYNGATEVVSMGLEYMYADPVKFAQYDPDYFDFIFNLVREVTDE